MEHVFERVYSITDYWDGPRAGVADYGGTPHAFRSVWSATDDDWDSDRFFVNPISTQQTAWEVEDWAIWLRFVEHNRGRAAPRPSDPKDWGALPEDLPRHRELHHLLADLRDIRADQCKIASAVFQVVEPSPIGFVAPKLAVSWTPAAPRPDDRILPLPAI